jgi:hypothetical protein
LEFKDFRCFTLELPWHGNSRSISCIPSGTYKATKYQSPKHGEVVLLHGVPNRSWIEVHAGNFTRQVEGCVLVGDGIKYLDGDDIPDVTNSGETLKLLLDLLPNEFDVLIERVKS